jgi:pyruvate,water dikinase
MTEKMCLKFDEITRNDVPVAGGKGANLGDMAQAGLPVPPGFVISAQAYRKAVFETGLDKKIASLLENVDRNDCNALTKVEVEVRNLFQGLALDDALRAEILQHYHELGDNPPVAVRSSGTAEDTAVASFAGQQSTFLNIYGDDEVIHAVLMCWASLFNSQAVFYRHRNGFDDNKVSIAVVVQRMINSEKSGVMFTVDPISKNPYNISVEGVYGLGEGIVSGEITPDHFKIDRETYEILYSYKAPKNLMYCKDGVCGVIKVDVPEQLASQSVLDEEELKQLVDIANKVEKHFGCPQDIEWGAEGNHIYLLQSRPITILN